MTILFSFFIFFKKILNSLFTLRALLESFKNNLLVAGPILNKNKKPKGSLIILDFKKKEEVINFLKGDPYSKVGLFEEIKIEFFKRVF